MATSRHESDCAPERKRARLVVESSSTPLSSSTATNSASSRWDWSSTSASTTNNNNNSYFNIIAMRNAASPGVNGNSSDSISLSGSSETGGAGGGAGGMVSQKTSPIATPVVVSSFNMTNAVPKSSSVSVDVTSPSSIVGGIGGGITSGINLIGGAGGGGANSSQSTDLRPFLIRSSLMNEEQNGTNANNSAVGIVAPWQLQDFGEGLTFDGSLSGLSDLAGPVYVNEMMEFVKRQSSHPPGMGNMVGDNFFQYILMAPTSAAVKLHEEPLTYLNQGQSYEIKCKKLGAETMTPGHLFKSIIRITFHDRRQKFQERELLDQWKKMHSGEKVTDADIPMSYNVFNVKTDPMGTVLEFLWDPTKSSGMFIKVNCISTEFTARKHGGEKGVPFRLQVDTYLYGDDVEHKQLHSCYTQVKVFKTKGADRKNKTDREKAEKRADKEKYQPAYDYTILTETFPTDVYDFEQQQQQQTDASTDDSVGHRESSPVAAIPKSIATTSPSPINCSVNSSTGTGTIMATMPIICNKPLCKETQPITANNGSRTSLCSMDSGVGSHGPVSPTAINEERGAAVAEALPIDATPADTMQWLRRQRFGGYLKVFSSFSGADFLRLSREDLIQICGTADGIRLFNALQYKKLQPKLTLYMSVPGAPAFHAVFLVSLIMQELVCKVCDLIQVQPSQVFDVYCQGPDGINVHMNDEVVQNLPDRSRFVIDAMKCGDEQSERYRILLKATSE